MSDIEKFYGPVKPSDVPSKVNEVIDALNTGSGVSWGNITGNLSDQTDLNTALTNLNTALDSKVDNTITINSYPLTEDITLSAADVGAATLTSSDFNAAEKVYNQGATAAIDLANGRIFYCTGTALTLPTAVDGVCFSCIITASTVTWAGNIRWKGDKSPSLTENYDIVTFIGYQGYWYGG